ncbi:MAG: hypothetical protein ACOCRK_00710 [bacterium]
MAYNPTFNRKPKGKFNPQTNYLSIKSGTNAYILEDEFNELQWMQNEARAELIRQITDSGMLQVKSWDNPNDKGGLIELGSDLLNGFGVNYFETIINGYVNKIQKNNNDIINIVLPEPPTNGTRHDFVYIEFWFSEVKESEPTHLYGGLYNDKIEYDIIDKRINNETSRRIQLQWAIRVKEDVNYNQYPLGFTNETKGSNPNVHPYGRYSLPINTYSYRKHNNDNNLFISGNGTNEDKKNLNTIDGYIYSLPMFIIQRLNSSGVYNVDNNPYGATNYTDDSVASIRPDEKYANIIYKDQVIDLRSMAFVGRDQYDLVYAKLSDFEEFRRLVGEDIDTRLAALEERVDLIDEKLELLYLYTHNDLTPRVDYIENYMKKLEKRMSLIESDPAFRDLLSYGINIEYDIYRTSGAQIDENTDAVISPGIMIPVLYDKYIEYGVLFSILNNDIGDIGSTWIEKSDESFLLKNSGSKEIPIDVGAIDAFHDSITLQTFSFNGIDGIKIDHVLSQFEFPFVCPIIDPIGSPNYTKGEIGEIYITIQDDGFTIHNTGSGITPFELIIIDTSLLKNVIFTDIVLNGIEGTTFTDEIGEEYQAYVSPPILQDGELDNLGSVGNISIMKYLGYFNVVNTGSPVGIVKCLVFKDPSIIL